jgi:hypothetical protein
MVRWLDVRGGSHADLIHRRPEPSSMSLTTIKQPPAEMPTAARAWLSRSGHAAVAKPWPDVFTVITSVLTGFERTNRAARLLGRAPT